MVRMCACGHVLGEFRSAIAENTGAYAARVGKNRWEEYTTFEVEDYVRTLEGQGTLHVNGWDEWWERARPLWNEWWRLKDAKPNVTRDELLNL